MQRSTEAACGMLPAQDTRGCCNYQQSHTPLPESSSPASGTHPPAGGTVQSRSLKLGVLAGSDLRVSSRDCTLSLVAGRPVLLGGNIVPGCT